MKLLNVICFLALLVSMCGGVYTSRTYILDTTKLTRMNIVLTEPHAAPNKIAAMVRGTKDEELILTQLKFHENQVNEQLKVIKELSSIGLRRSYFEMILWIVLSVILTALQMRLYSMLTKKQPA